MYQTMYGKLAFCIICIFILMCIWGKWKEAEAESAAVEQFTQAGLAAYADRAKPALNTFSNTLQRRMGMGSAGGSADGSVKTPVENFGTNSTVGTFDSLRQNFSSGDVAANTMMAGFQRPLVLPLGRA